MYSVRLLTISADNSVVVNSAALMSPINGMDTLPSGRTGTDTDNSGLRQTLISSASPTPILYSTSIPASMRGGCSTSLVVVQALSISDSARQLIAQINFFTRVLLLDCD